MNCRKCDSNNVIKNGKSIKGIQLFRCKECSNRFQLAYTNQSKVISDHQIIVLVKEGCGIRSISRILKISPTTVISRIKLISDLIDKPRPIVLGKSYGIDELCTYLGKKKRRVWITYALEKGTKNIIDFTVGTRSNKTMRKVTDTVLLSEPKEVFTDKFKNYKTLIPESIHTTRRRCINHIERMNLNLRTHLKRLNRRTICYSKSLIMLSACLEIYFWG